MRLQQYINEVFKFKTKYELNREEQNQLVYSFELGDIIYGVNIYVENNFDSMVSEEDLDRIENLFNITNIKREEIWEVDFFEVDSFEAGEYSVTYDITGKQGPNAIKVFSAVMNIVKDVIKKKNIKYLLFVADNDEPPRVKLYEKFVKRYFKLYTKAQTIGETIDFTAFIMKV